MSMFLSVVIGVLLFTRVQQRFNEVDNEKDVCYDYLDGFYETNNAVAKDRPRIVVMLPQIVLPH